MRSNRIAALTSTEYLLRLLSYLLLFGLVLLLDGWMLVRVSRRWGVYLSLACEAGTALIGVVVMGSTINSRRRQIRLSAIQGIFKPEEYAELLVTVAATALLILPGFAGDFLGILFYLPPGKQIATYFLARVYEPLFRESYEYYKLDLFSDEENTLTKKSTTTSRK